MLNNRLQSRCVTLIHRYVLFIGAGAVVLSGCASRPHSYKPPDATRMNEAREKLSGDVDRATASAKKIQEHVRNAQVSAGKVANFSGTIEVKLGKLHGRVTAELRPEVESIQADVSAEKQEETLLAGELTSAIARQKTLEGELNQANADKVELTKESQDFYQKAQELAQKATDENTAKIKAERSLSYYRWHSWLFKIGAALAVVFIVVFLFLWLTGGLARLASRFV